MITAQNTRLGILLMVATTVVFSAQDAITRHLAERYSPFMVVMIRYWFFALFAITMTARTPGGLARAMASPQIPLQVFRGVLLVAEVVAMVYAFTHLGLIQSHSIFACYPLLVAALSGPVLGERVGWRRWTAITIGFVGVLIILEPGVTSFSGWAVIPLICAFMFALYGLTTRFVARRDPAPVSFFWTGVAGAAAMTLVGVWHWETMTPSYWGFMAILCCTAALGHWLLIRAFEVAEASAIQPFAFLQLIFASAIGMTVFGDPLYVHTVVGAAVVVSAGLFTLWRARVKHQPGGVTGPSVRP